jgi:leucyl aminopeptidase (aminopeptidase T)
MNLTVVPALLASVFAAAPTARAEVAAASDADAAVNKAAGINLDELAQRIVTQSARVKEGEIVYISGGVRDLELLEDLATHVSKVGAFPLVALSSDRMIKRSFTDVPAKYDSQEPKLYLALADTLDAVIQVDSFEAADVFEGLSAERRAARDEAFAPVNKKILDNSVRSVEVGNGLYPTSWRAQRFGMSQGDLAKSFWEGVNVDYSGLQSRGEAVKAALSAGKELRIVNSANGTDVTLGIAARPIVVSDGIISAADVKQGGAAVSVYLPAGEVMITPVADTAKGKVVVDRLYFDDKEIQNMTLNFAAGKIVSMSGSGPGYAAFKASYEATSDPGKAAFAYADFGINDKVRLPKASKIGTWVPAGMVTIGIGNNLTFGGENNSPYGFAFFLPGTTVTLDGKTIVENGNLKL